MVDDHVWQSEKKTRKQIHNAFVESTYTLTVKKKKKIKITTQSVPLLLVVMETMQFFFKFKTHKKIQVYSWQLQVIIDQPASCAANQQHALQKVSRLRYRCAAAEGLRVPGRCDQWCWRLSVWMSGCLVSCTRHRCLWMGTS